MLKTLKQNVYEEFVMCMCKRMYKTEECVFLGLYIQTKLLTQYREKITEEVKRLSRNYVSEGNYSDNYIYRLYKSIMQQHTK